MSATIADLIDLAISAELSVEHLYATLERMFAHEPEVAHFWKHYAAAESGHARWLRNLRAQLSQTELSTPADAAILTAAQSALTFTLEEVVEDLHTLDDAYELVNELEHSETNAVFQFLIEHFAKDTQAQSFLRKQLNEHINALTFEFPESFRTPVARRAVSAQRA